MTGDSGKAQEAFQDTLREGARRSAGGEPPADRMWFFREARFRCLALGDEGLQCEECEIEEHELSPHAPEQISQLGPEQLAIWISGAPDPQRSALAAFYLDEFTPREILVLLELKAHELARFVRSARRQFQAWLNVTTPVEVYEDE